MKKLGPTWPTDEQLEEMLARPNAETMQYLNRYQQTARRSRDRILLGKLIELLSEKMAEKCG